MRKNYPQFIVTLLISLITTFLSILLNNLLAIIKDILLKLLEKEQLAILLPVLFSIFFIFLVGMWVPLLLLALKMGSQARSIKDVTSPKQEKLSTKQKLLGFQYMLSQLRNSFIATLLLIIAIILLTGPYITWWALAVIIFIIVIDSIREFYVSTGFMRRSIENAIVQIITTLGKQLDLMAREALGENDFKIRCYLMLRKEDFLYVRYSYRMAGDPDWEMGIGINQGIEGRVYNSGKPWGKTPYDPEELGFSEEQINKIPKNIKWKLGFPISPNQQAIGVLIIDCDTVLEMEWLDKILDFAHGITSCISTIICQYPSKIIQEAFYKHEIIDS